MHSDAHTLSGCEDKIAKSALEKKHCDDVTALATELKRLMARYHTIFKQEGVGKEMERLENWLEEERKGPAPAHVISESGIAWLTGLRDQLKLSAEEAQRLESEGGNPSSKEQIQKTEDLLKTVRRIDKIMDESAVAKPH